MSIIKLRSPQFVSIPSATVRDPGLMDDGLALLVFLLDFPTDWNVTIKWIVSTKRFGSSRKVCATLKQLREHGYAKLKKHKDGTTEWHITSTKGVFEDPRLQPDFQNGNEGEPDFQNANLRNANFQNANLRNGNALTNSTDTDNQETDGEKNKARAPKFTAADMPEVSKETAEAFIQHRKSTKTPLNAFKWKEILDDCEKAGWEPERAIRFAMKREWKGFDAEWLINAAPKQQQQRTGRTYVNGNPVNDITANNIENLSRWLEKQETT